MQAIEEICANVVYTRSEEISNILKGFPAGWTIWNAPRPIYGTTAWTGEFLCGMFYTAINPAESFAFEWMQENVRLDAALVVYVPFQEAKNAVVALLEAQGYSDMMEMLSDQEVWCEYVQQQPKQRVVRIEAPTMVAA